jgi:hypothetical protein
VGATRDGGSLETAAESYWEVVGEGTCLLSRCIGYLGLCRDSNIW